MLNQVAEGVLVHESEFLRSDSVVVQHRADAPGHASLLIEERGVLVAGDTLSDILMPFLGPEAADPVGDCLAALRLLEGVAERVTAVIPGHGSVGGADRVRGRIERDGACVEALHDGRDPDDPRIGLSAPLDGLPDVHDWQRLAERRRRSS